MHTSFQQYSFKDILHQLSLQNPEDKLRTAFRLRTFVNQLRAAGKQHATNERHRTRRTS